MSEKHDRFMDIIIRLNEMGGRSEHYYQTPEGTIHVWWGSGRWEHQWIELEQWSPAEDTLTEILTSDRLIDARLESEITEDPKMVSMAEDGLKELLEMGIELGISEAFKSIGLKLEPSTKRIGENVEQKHAGLEDGKLNLITFNDTEQLRVMLIAIGFSINDKDIVYHEGKPVICSSCERELTLDEIGYVMPPSYFYCSSDVCICDYFERYGYPDETSPFLEETKKIINLKTGTEYGIRPAGSKDHDTNIGGKWKKDHFPKEPKQDILNCPDREVLDEENIICNGTDGKPDNYDCPRLIAEDRCPRGYKQDNRARPECLEKVKLSYAALEASCDFMEKEMEFYKKLYRDLKKEGEHEYLPCEICPSYWEKRVCQALSTGTETIEVPDLQHPPCKEFKPLYYIDGDGEAQLCSKQSSVEKPDKGEE